jgi:hypothetical protein
MPTRTAWLLLAIGLGFVAGGVFILIAGDAEDRILGLAWVLFFGACALVGGFALLPRRALLPGSDGAVTLLPDRLQLVGLCAGGAGMSAGSFYIGQVARAEGGVLMSLLCWTGVAFFGLAAVLGVWRLLNPKPLARLDAEGVHVFGRMGWSLRWRDIGAIGQIEIGSQRFVAFEAAARAPGSFSDRANDALGMPRHMLGVSGTAARFEDLHAHALAFWSRHRGR